MLYRLSTLKEILNFLYRERADKNPAYSLRAFAKKTGLSHSTLQDVVAGKKNLSSERMLEIAKRLELGESETEYIFLVMERQRLTHSPLSKSIDLRLRSLQMNHDRPPMDDDHFKMISEWEHVAVYTAIGSNSESDALSSLKIQPERLKEVLNRLEKAGFIETTPDGAYRQTDARLLFSSQKPNEALREFHLTMLNKAADHLLTDQVEQRFIGTETFFLDRQTLAEAKKLANEFLDSLVAISEKTMSSQRAIYHAGLQIFPLGEIKETL